MIDKVNDISFVPALGLALWGNAVYDDRGGRSFLSRFKGVGRITDKIKKMFKSLMP